MTLNPNLFRKFADVGSSYLPPMKLELMSKTVVYIGDLVHMDESTLERNSMSYVDIYKIKQILSDMDLELGMHIEDWPPENLEEISRMFQA